jgi:nitric oxide reductase large subunit
VLTGALVIGHRQLGMVWPGLGWMAASLFALAGYRNTAPGQPPIGCLLDYTVFLWAEAIVAFSVVYAVLRGTRVEVRAAEAEQNAEVQPG